MATLSIIILSYNTKDLTLQCIESIVKQYEKELENGEIEIIVVDNDSKDGTIETVEERFLHRHSGKPKAHPESPTAMGDAGQASMTQNRNIIIIQNKENYGFAKGCNIGAKTAKGKYILFLNSDTEVLDKGFLKMVEFVEQNNDIGILGGRLLNPNNTPQRSGGKFYNLWNLFLMLLGGDVFIRKAALKIEKIDWVSGACMMIKKSLFEKLSGFDEHFFMYVEDMELCFRAQKLGFSTYFYSDINVTHKSLGSGNKTFAIINIYKGILYFYSKHKSYFEYVVAKLFLVTKAIIVVFIGTITLNTGLQERYKKALNF